MEVVEWLELSLAQEFRGSCTEQPKGDPGWNASRGGTGGPLLLNEGSSNSQLSREGCTFLQPAAPGVLPEEVGGERS